MATTRAGFATVLHLAFLSFAHASRNVLRTRLVRGVLRKSCRLIDMNRESGWRRLVAEEAQPGRGTAYREQSAAVADHHWGDHQPQFVDQPCGQQRLAQPGTAVDLQLPTGLPL